MQPSITTITGHMPPRDTLRDNILDALAAWIRQRPGLDPRNYISGWHDAAGRAAYRAESRTITRQRHDAERLLRYIHARPTITGVELLAGFNGRLTYTPERGLDYCVGQYWPTEYRAAACRVLVSVLWDRWAQYAGDMGADHIRETARHELGATIARRWFR